MPPSYCDDENEEQKLGWGEAQEGGEDDPWGEYIIDDSQGLYLD